MLNNGSMDQIIGSKLSSYKWSIKCGTGVPSRDSRLGTVWANEQQTTTGWVFRHSARLQPYYQLSIFEQNWKCSREIIGWNFHTQGICLCGLSSTDWTVRLSEFEVVQWSPSLNRSIVFVRLIRNLNLNLIRIRMTEAWLFWALEISLQL